MKSVVVNILTSISFTTNYRKQDETSVKAAWYSALSKAVIFPTSTESAPSPTSAVGQQDETDQLHLTLDKIRKR